MLGPSALWGLVLQLSVANEKTLWPRWLETLCSKTWQLSGACLLVGARALLLSPALCLPLVSAHSSFLTYLSFVILHSRSLLYSLRFLPWPLSGIFQLSSHCWFSCCHQGGNHHHCLCPHSCFGAASAGFLLLYHSLY